jgi:hypothetical protein
MSDRKERKVHFLPGALAFFGMVLYINIRGDHTMTWLDWTVVIGGGLFILFSLWHDLKK